LEYKLIVGSREHDNKTFWLHKISGNYWVDKRMLTSQERLCSIKLVSCLLSLCHFVLFWLSVPPFLHSMPSVVSSNLSFFPFWCAVWPSLATSSAQYPKPLCALGYMLQYKLSDLSQGTCRSDMRHRYIRPHSMLRCRKRRYCWPVLLTLQCI
jgi:hypothetical protein